MRNEVGSILGGLVFAYFGIAAVRLTIVSNHHLYYGFLSAFYWLGVYIYMTRKPALVGAKGWDEWVVPLVATFGPLVPFFLVDPSPRYEMAGYAVAAIGMAFSVWGLYHLKGNFSIVVEARDVVASGPYRIVRHPLYVGETVAVTGLALSAPHAITFATVILLITLQLWRGWMEEKKLLETFGYKYEAVQRQAWWPLTPKIGDVLNTDQQVSLCEKSSLEQSSD